MEKVGQHYKLRTDYRCFRKHRLHNKKDYHCYHSTVTTSPVLIANLNVSKDCPAPTDIFLTMYIPADARVAPLGITATLEVALTSPLFATITDTTYPRVAVTRLFVCL
jgi:hypothetical protein